MRRLAVLLCDLLITPAAIAAGLAFWPVIGSTEVLADAHLAMLQPVIVGLEPWRVGLLGGFAVLVVARLALSVGGPTRRPRPLGKGEKKPRKLGHDDELAAITKDAPDALQLAEQLLLGQTKAANIDMKFLVDDVILIASQLGASDIHLEPRADALRMTLRIDGLMRDVAMLPKHLEKQLGIRLKVMSQLDITGSGHPQDGRVRESIRGREMNLRVSIFPTHYGEKSVIRLLDEENKSALELDDLAIAPHVLERFRQLVRKPQGLVIISGPTGSGKTTLVYAVLREISTTGTSRMNIVTLEDPVERVLPDVNQTQVDAKRGLTFAAGLRTLLRQDPDIMLVGEIRDLETAQIALQAGQTGHLLLTTLHTNSAAASFARLIDMGCEPFLLAAAITGVVSIRLVRRLCPKCRVKHTPSETLLAQLNIDPRHTFFEAKGCAACQDGFRGRMAIFELLLVNEPVGAVISRKGTSNDILHAARSEGLPTLMQDGLDKVFSGQTSLSELLRVVQ